MPVFTADFHLRHGWIFDMFARSFVPGELFHRGRVYNNHRATAYKINKYLADNVNPESGHEIYYLACSI